MRWRRSAISPDRLFYGPARTLPGMPGDGMAVAAGLLVRTTTILRFMVGPVFFSVRMISFSTLRKLNKTISRSQVLLSQHNKTWDRPDLFAELSVWVRRRRPVGLLGEHEQ